jgi:hypothetical protein
MRDCYKKFWKRILVERIPAALPQFALKESAARKTADDEAPSSKPNNFVWNPVDKLVFTIEFRAPGRLDHFECWFYWSETGKTGANGTAPLNNPFVDISYELVNASTMLSDVSGAIDGKLRISRWAFWQPTLELGTTRESHAAWQAEFEVEERRYIGDEEARQRVEVAVDKAIIDIKRLALPWFEKKLEWYKQHKAT